jgi:hypothetical protein
MDEKPRPGVIPIMPTRILFTMTCGLFHDGWHACPARMLVCIASSGKRAAPLLPGRADPHAIPVCHRVARQFSRLGNL